MRRTPPPPLPKRPRRGPADPLRRAWAWVAAFVVLIGIVLAWRVAVVVGERDATDAAVPATPTSEPSPPPGDEGTRGGRASGAFPRAAVGMRLEFKVFSLGDDPERCEPAVLRVDDEPRTVFHYACVGLADPELEPYFFLAQLTNLASASVTVQLAGFGVTGVDGSPHDPLPTPDIPRAFPTSIALGPHASVKGWVTFDGRIAFVPKRLTYLDDGEALTVRFTGSWVGLEVSP